MKCSFPSRPHSVYLLPKPLQKLMKFLQHHGFVPIPSHFVRVPAYYPPISTPFHIFIRRSSPLPYISPSLSSNRHKKCLTTKFPISFFDFPATEVSAAKIASPFYLSVAHLPLMAVVLSPLPCFAVATEQISAKINLESVLVSVDDFFNRYPYFVASIAFVWLVVIPLTEEYLNKYKFISCIDAFRKLKDDPNTQLLDIRKKQTAAYLRTPNLKIFNKGAVNLEFVEGPEEEFVKEALKSFQDPRSTIICVLDNFDGNSLEVAKLLFKKGFKEAYAIKGGVLGKDGWQAIQGTLLPPSIHVRPIKIPRKSPDHGNDEQKVDNEDGGNGQLLTSFSTNQKVIESTENGYIESSKSSSTAQNFEGRPLSPYPNYIDLKPPSSPTQSKSQKPKRDMDFKPP